MRVAERPAGVSRQPAHYVRRRRSFRSCIAAEALARFLGDFCIASAGFRVRSTPIGGFPAADSYV